MAALSTASAKLDLGFAQAVALGLLCNALVCLAVWLTFSARTTADRVLAIVPPISAFVPAGFEGPDDSPREGPPSLRRREQSAGARPLASGAAGSPARSATRRRRSRRHRSTGPPPAPPPRER